MPDFVFSNGFDPRHRYYKEVCHAIVPSRSATRRDRGAFACGAAHAADWTQFGYDAAHTGVNPAETLISPSNVASLVTKYSVDDGRDGR